MSHAAASAAQSLSDAGFVPTYSAAPAGGLILPGDGDSILHVKNGGGGSINVTVQTGATAGGLAVADQVVAVANGSEKIIGPFRSDVYNQPSSGPHGAGVVLVDFSGVATVTYGHFTK